MKAALFTLGSRVGASAAVASTAGQFIGTSQTLGRHGVTAGSPLGNVTYKGATKSDRVSGHHQDGLH
jgi:hypothetical protein